MSNPAPTAPAGTGPTRRRRLLRCLAARIGKIVRAAHSASVPF
jgi:hypothetical protein